MAIKNHTYSAILINYNHAGFLPSAIGGLLEQSIPFDEIIVVDDASTDDSVAIIEGLIRNMPQARLVRHSRNEGIIDTLNSAVAEARSEFVFLLAADDTYNKDMIAWCEKLLAQYPDVGMISGNTCIVEVATGKEHPFILPFPQTINSYCRSDLEAIARKRSVTFFGGSNIFRRDALLAAGGQRKEFAWHADWFFYLLMACRYPFGTVPIEMARIRLAGDQYSHASTDWARQRPVIQNFIRLLRSEYPEEYVFFRRCGLLPTYDIEALPLLLGDRELRAYLTPLLVWRLLSYKTLRKVGRCFSPRLRHHLRRFLRV